MSGCIVHCYNASFHSNDLPMNEFRESRVKKASIASLVEESSSKVLSPGAAANVFRRFDGSCPGRPWTVGGVRG